VRQQYEGGSNLRAAANRGNTVSDFFKYQSMKKVILEKNDKKVKT